MEYIPIIFHRGKDHWITGSRPIKKQDIQAILRGGYNGAYDRGGEDVTALEHFKEAFFEDYTSKVEEYDFTTLAFVPVDDLLYPTVDVAIHISLGDPED